jgi:Fis family transcriptional regulator
VRHQIENLVAQMQESGIGYAEAVREFKRRFILNVLDRNKGNQSRAARELGMHRNTLSRTLTELEISHSDSRSPVRRPPASERTIPSDKRTLRQG